MCKDDKSSAQQSANRGRHMGIQRTFRKKSAVPPTQPVPGTEVQETNWAEWEIRLLFSTPDLRIPPLRH
jgi:hypothetical protein